MPIATLKRRSARKDHNGTERGEVVHQTFPPLFGQMFGNFQTKAQIESAAGFQRLREVCADNQFTGNHELVLGDVWPFQAAESLRAEFACG